MRHWLKGVPGIQGVVASEFTRLHECHPLVLLPPRMTCFPLCLLAANAIVKEPDLEPLGP